MSLNKYKIKILPLVILLVKLVLICGSIEVSARIYWKLNKRLEWADNVFAYAPYHSVFSPLEGTNDDWLYTPHFPFETNQTQNELTSRRILKMKSRNVFRMFFLGSSSTAGLPIGNSASFSQLTKKYLQKIKKKEVEIESINLGVSFFNSEEVYHLLERVVDFEPDVVFFYLGACELCPKYNSASLSRFPLSAQKLFDNLFSLRLLFLNTPLRKSFLDNFDWLATETRGLTAEERTKVNTRFEEQLRRIKTLLTAKNIPGVFILPLSNFVKPPRTVSQIDRDLEMLFKKKGCQTERFKHSYSKGNPTEDFYTAACILEQGHQELAYSTFQKLLDQDPYPERAGVSKMSLLSKLQDIDLKIYYLDVSQGVQKYLGDKIIDGRVLYDRGHPNLLGHSLIAREIMNLFFNKYHVRPDLFDYSRFVGPNVELIYSIDGSYSHVCMSLVPSQTKTLNDCYTLLYDEYANSKTEVERRYHARGWEPLFFLGRERGDPDLIKKSLKMRALTILPSEIANKRR